MSMAGADPHAQCPVQSAYVIIIIIICCILYSSHCIYIPAQSAAMVYMVGTQSNNNRDFLANKIHTPKCDWFGMETLVGMHS